MSLQGVDDNRLAWIALGIGLAAVLAAVAYAFLGTLVFGVFLYYATRPVHRRVSRRITRPTVAALISLLALAVPVLLLVAYTVAIALQELSDLASTVDFGPYASAIEPYLDVGEAVADPGSLLQDPGNVQAVVDAVLSALSYLGVAGSGLLYLFVAFTLAFYLLRDGHRLREYLRLLAGEDRVLDSYAGAVDGSLRDVFFGNILTVLLTGAIGAVAFNVLNLASPAAFSLPYPALAGLLAGAASLIPVVGMKLVYVPLVASLAVQAARTGTGWEFVALVAGVSVVVVDFLPDMLLRPYVSGGDLHTGTVMFAYVLGPVFFGWYGLFLGPLVLVLAWQFARLVLPELVADEPTPATATDPTETAGEPASSDASEGADRESDPDAGGDPSSG